MIDDVSTSRAIVILSAAARRLEAERVISQALGESGIFHKFYAETWSGIVSFSSIIDSLATSEILIVDSLSVSARINQAIGAALALGKKIIVLSEHDHVKISERHGSVDYIGVNSHDHEWRPKLLKSLYRVISATKSNSSNEWNINYTDVDWSTISRTALRRISSAIARQIDLRSVSRPKFVDRLPDMGYTNGLYATRDKKVFWIVFYYPSLQLPTSTDKIDLTRIISNFNIENANDQEFRILVVTLTDKIAEHRRNLSTRIISSIGRVTKIMLAGQKEIAHIMNSESYLMVNTDILKSSSSALEIYRYKNEISILKKENLELREKLGMRLEEIQREERYDIWESIAFTAAHKFKNPLFRIEMYTKSLRTLLADVSEDKVVRSLAGISDAVETSKFVLSQFTSLSSAKSINKKVITIDELCERCSRLSNPDIYTLNITREYNNREILVDLDNLMICIEEIVGNSRRYIPDKSGKIDILIKSNHDDGGSELIIELSDNGIGIPHDEKEKIFDPFFSTRDQGTGIGLASTKLTIDSHGGNIEECGEPGVGARFRIALPAHGGYKNG